MTQFHHCGNPVHEKYKSYDIINSIPPLREAFVQKILNHSNSMT